MHVSVYGRWGKKEREGGKSANGDQRCFHPKTRTSKKRYMKNTRGGTSRTRKRGFLRKIGERRWLQGKGR